MSLPFPKRLNPLNYKWMKEVFCEHILLFFDVVVRSFQALDIFFAVIVVVVVFIVLSYRMATVYKATHSIISNAQTKSAITHETYEHLTTMYSRTLALSLSLSFYFILSAPQHTFWIRRTKKERDSSWNNALKIRDRNNRNSVRALK